MNRAIILNKLKLLDIRHPWQVSIVKELSSRRGASACIEPLFVDTRRRLKAGKDSSAKKKFNLAVADLIKFSLLYEKTTISGVRLHLLTAVWQLEDAIILGILTQTLASCQGRKSNINWKTILKEVRKELSSHKIKLPNKVTATLVRYFLVRQCGWKILSDQSLLAPKQMRKKSLISPEQQHDLFN